MKRSSQDGGARPQPARDLLDLGHVARVLWQSKWMVGGITALVFAAGCIVAMLVPPVYQANLLIKVDLGDAAPKNLPANLSGLFELKTAATSELELLRSRAVVTGAVEAFRLYIEAAPKRLPVVGAYVAEHNPELSEPGLFGYGGTTWGSESIAVQRFDVPASMTKKAFVVQAEAPGTYNLQYGGHVYGRARVGEQLQLQIPAGEVILKIDEIQGRPGAEFVLKRTSRVDAVEKLQKALVIAENNKASGIISVSLQYPEANAAAAILNEIARQYLQQNVSLRSEDAERSLAFVESQLPGLKTSLETAEARYSAFRNNRGTVDVAEEVKAALQLSVQSQVRMVELRQRRDELLTRYQNENPLVEAVNQQIRTGAAEIASLNEKLKKIPATEQDAAQLTRDVKVNTDLYSSLLATAQQLRLAKASSIGSARLIDSAVIPTTPVKPNRKLIAAAAAVAGLLVAMFTALFRNSFINTIDDRDELARAIDLPVTAVVPHSALQVRLLKAATRKDPRLHLLAENASETGAMESLRTFRTAIDFSIRHAPNNIIAIVGPTSGVGKSFVAANLSALIASSRKRVLLIDADVRGGTLHQYFGRERAGGLAEAITSEMKLEDATQHVAGTMHFMSTGSLRPHPADLLATDALSLVLNELSSRFDYVVIDTPPTLPVADALIIAKHVGLVYCVARRGVTSVRQLLETQQRFQQSGTPLTGLVFNDAKPTDVAYGASYRSGPVKSPLLLGTERA
jgi:tyrosine-protein kinase Etk/Wzc